MWRRAYLFLVLVRLYFALSPSYLHPDENFQGPEVIAGTSAVLPLKRTPIEKPQMRIASLFKHAPDIALAHLPEL